MRAWPQCSQRSAVGIDVRLFRNEGIGSTFSNDTTDRRSPPGHLGGGLSRTETEPVGGCDVDLSADDIEQTGVV